ncbi:polysaccharide biosynthesis tyrosine autokinase [Marinilabiliaceae bacterium ANBcel2]|nr:polysaccharide biosynthesis tyrosine autokinase [Marinilabiliaceae bacterium ANBcel2]
MYNPREFESNSSKKNPLTSDATSPFLIDYKKLLVDLLRFWWLFVIAIVIALTAVYIMHRYSQPVYRAGLRLLMEERGTEQPKSDMMEGFGLSSAMRSLENQVAILSSYETVYETVKELDFAVSYYKIGRVKDSELYAGNIPFTVHYNRTSPQLTNIPIYLSVIDNERYRINVNSDYASTYIYDDDKSGPSRGAISFEGEFKFGEEVSTPYMNFIIENLNLSRSKERGYYFTFNNINRMASVYQSRFRAVRSNDNTSIVNLSVTGNNTGKNIDFLNKLAEVFIRNNLEKKNEIATNTIEFIETQLKVISDSLDNKGTELSDFRTTHQVQSVSAQSGLLFNRLEEFSKQQSQLTLQLKYYEYLKDYFSADDVFENTLAPASYSIDNSIIANQINNIIELNMERQTLDALNNPYFKELTRKMEVARRTLINAIDNQINIINEDKERLNQKRQEVTAELYELPEMERQLFGIERQFTLNNEVYTFLLRKRSEAQIQKASNTPDHSVLEQARYTGQVSPTISADRQKALLVGLVLPLLFLVLRQLMNNRLSSPDEVERVTKLPVAGHVIHNTKDVTNVVYHYPRSVISETFRRIRTRLEYFTSGKNSPVIAVSSSMPGEGKTFCALNIATVFALSGKKTLLIGCDMRKPGLSKILDIDATKGLSEYLIGKVNIKEITQTNDQENLYIIPSGNNPPNPSELISNGKMEQLFKEAKKSYEVIILDTPPMGVVSDGYVLARYADSVLFLTRLGFTVRDVFAYTLKQLNDEGIKNIGILINDIHIKKGLLGYNYNYGYGYGYGYSYGYGYGYYDE